MELRLRTCLKTEVKLLSVLDNLLYYRIYLVYLDRIDDKVLRSITILLTCLLKTDSRLFDTVVYDVRETYKYWCRYIPQGKIVHHFLEVNLYPVLTRSDSYITLIIYTKIVNTPTIYSIKFVGVLNTPFPHLF